MINLTMIKYAGIAAMLALYGWIAYDYGATSMQSAWHQETAKLNAATANAMSAINDDNVILSKKLAAKKLSSDMVREVVKVETVEVDKEVIKYVTKYRDTECNAIDDEWVRIYNQSAKRSKAITVQAK